MKGIRFTNYVPPPAGQANFDSLSKIFLQLLGYTAGDADEAISWLNDLDNQYGLTDGQYGMGDFLDDLKREGYLSDDNPTGDLKPTAKTEQALRQRALEDIFGKLKKSESGSHRTSHTGQGDEASADLRGFQFGDPLDSIDLTQSIHNAQVRSGIEDMNLTQDDLEIREREHKASMATVLMIDISHSMILYGEDRITPAKQVAMALAELITKRYKQDTLDIVVFGNDAWPIEIKDLPYLQVGPYHTNTVAGLELAMNILRRRRTPNKQIIMITDGKPTCLKVGVRYYKNSFGLDRKVVGKTLNLAAQCRRVGIPITTFMIARDPYLQQFVRQFTETNQGRAYYSSLDGLGEFVFEDFIRNRRKNVRF